MPAERDYVPRVDATLMTAAELLHKCIPNEWTELVRGILTASEPTGYLYGGWAS